jgi:O-antigen ligase
LLERLTYWKTAQQLISTHFILGVGIGDLQDQMQAQYVKQNSELRPDRRLRPHNYYLTTWLNTGLIGFILLLSILYFYLKQQWNYRQLQGFLFGLVFAFSFLIEDGLETQMGLTMFAFFYAFYSRRVVA